MLRPFYVCCLLLLGCSDPEPASSGMLHSIADSRIPAQLVLVPWGDAAPRSVCESVAHIGDSTSVRLEVSDLYRAAGVTDLRFESVGGRSLVEHRTNKETGPMVAQRLIKSGFEGCWVIALGVNDAANLARGGRNTPVRRIRHMMDTISPSPVLWVDSATITDHGYYKDMSLWNESLDAVLSDYPNAVIYKWSDDVRDEWFVKDGIHYNRSGNEARAEHIVKAFADAF